MGLLGMLMNGGLVFSYPKWSSLVSMMIFMTTNVWLV